MKTLVVIFSVIGLLTLNSCKQETDVQALMENAETRSEVLSIITENHKFMTEFMEQMHVSEHAMQMMQGNKNMMGTMMKGQGMQMMMKDAIPMPPPPQVMPVQQSSGFNFSYTQVKEGEEQQEEQKVAQPSPQSMMMPQYMMPPNMMAPPPLMAPQQMYGVMGSIPPVVAGNGPHMSQPPKLTKAKVAPSTTPSKKTSVAPMVPSVVVRAKK